MRKITIYEDLNEKEFQVAIEDKKFFTVPINTTPDPLTRKVLYDAAIRKVAYQLANFVKEPYKIECYVAVDAEIMEHSYPIQNSIVFREAYKESEVGAHA